MTSRGDKVEKSMNSVVSETGVSLNSGFFSEDIIILSLQVSSNFSETSFIINLITKSRSIDHCQSNTSSLFFKIYSSIQHLGIEVHTDSDGFDSHTVFDVCVFGIVCLFVFQYRLPTQCVDKCCFTCSTCPYDHEGKS